MVNSNEAFDVVNTIDASEDASERSEPRSPVWRVKSHRSILSLSAYEAKVRRGDAPQVQEGPDDVHSGSVDSPGIAAARATSFYSSPYGETSMRSLNDARDGCRRCGDHDALKTRLHSLELKAVTIDKLEADNGRLGAEVEMLRRENADLTAALREVQGQVTEQHSSNQKLKLQAMEDARKLADAVREGKETRERLEAAEEKLKIAAQEKRATDRTIAAAMHYEDKAAAAKRDCDAFRRLHADAQRRADLLTDDLRREREKSAAAADAVAEAKRLLAAESKFAAEKQQLLARAEEANSDLQIEMAEVRRRIAELAENERQYAHIRRLVEQADVTLTETAKMHKAADVYIGIKTLPPPPRLVRYEPFRGRNCEQLGFGSSAVQRPGDMGSIPTCSAHRQHGGGVIGTPRRKRAHSADVRRRG